MTVTLLRHPGYSIEHDCWFIRLTKGVIALVDADQVPSLAQHNWGAARNKGQFYAIRNVRDLASGRDRLMHRVIMQPAAPEVFVDHIYHAPLSDKLIDNRRSNLRLCTFKENVRNSRKLKPGSSRFKGVHWHRRDKRWQAKIGVDGVRKHLGNFIDESAAARAYDAAAADHFGDFALTNKQMGLLS